MTEFEKPPTETDVAWAVGQILWWGVRMIAYLLIVVGCLMFLLWK
jgi:hypothetical protein